MKRLQRELDSILDPSSAHSSLGSPRSENIPCHGFCDNVKNCTISRLKSVYTTSVPVRYWINSDLIDICNRGIEV